MPDGIESEWYPETVTAIIVFIVLGMVVFYVEAAPYMATCGNSWKWGYTVANEQATSIQSKADPEVRVFAFTDAM